MTGIDTAFAQQILNIAEREGETNVEHRRQSNDLGAGVEVAKWGTSGHQKMATKASLPGSTSFLLTMPCPAFDGRLSRSTNSHVKWRKVVGA